MAPRISAQTGRAAASHPGTGKAQVRGLKRFGQCAGQSKAEVVPPSVALLPTAVRGRCGRLQHLAGLFGMRSTRLLFLASEWR